VNGFKCESISFFQSAKKEVNFHLLSNWGKYLRLSAIEIMVRKKADIKLSKILKLIYTLKTQKQKLGD
jgi:hypothetical protein